MAKVKRSKDGVPIDGGWGWMCVLGAMGTIMLTIGNSKSMGIFFIEFMDLYGASASETAWIVTCRGIAAMVFSPVAGLMSSRYSNRTCIMLAGLVGGVGAILTSFTTNVIQAIFSFGLCLGFTTAFVYALSIGLLPQYFIDKRASAISIASTGACLGQLLFPIIIVQLVERYAFRGALIIYGAISFNIIMFGSLLRPPSYYTNIFNRKKSKEMISMLDKDSSKDENVTIVLNQEITEDKSHGQSSMLDDVKISNDKRSEKLEHPDISEEVTQDHKKDNSLRKKKFSMGFSLFRNPSFVVFLIGLFFIACGYTQIFVCIPHHARDIGLDKTQAAVLLAIIGVCDGVARLLCGFILDLKLVKKYTNTVTIYSITVLITGASSMLVPYLRQFELLVIYSVIFGLFGGQSNALALLVIVEVVGRDKSTSAMTYAVVDMGLGLSIGPLILGSVRDYTGSYNFAFIMMGGAEILGGLILLTRAAIKKIRS